MGESDSAALNVDVAARRLVNERVERLADLVLRLSSAKACFIEWRGEFEQGSFCLPNTPAARRAAALTREQLAPTRPSRRVVRIASSAILGSDGEGQGVSVAVTESAAGIALVGVLVGDAASNQLEGILEIAAMAVAAAVEASSHHSSREFWRNRADELARRLAAIDVRVENDERAARRVRDIVDRASRIRPNGRAARLGALVASAGPFDGWVLALVEGGCCGSRPLLTELSRRS